MTKKPGRGGGKKTVLTDEDHEVWAHTARSLSPLRKKKGYVLEALDGEEEFLELFAPKTKPHGPGKKKDEVAVAAAKPAAKMAVPHLNAFDRKNAKKLKRGRIEIEARIDLHGMRQAEAHTALIRFIRRSAAAGKRWVLVITGKGSPSRREGEDHERPFGEPPRGVLKRSVPIWLAEPEVRGLIVSFTEAAVEHGGSGALYVHLRRQGPA